jgi:transaldolase
MSKLKELTQLGQSVWLDFIKRSFIESGELKKLVDDGLRGVTSNPTIFERAIAGSSDYDSDLKKLIGLRKSLDQIYEGLVIEDIRGAADVLKSVYNETGGDDGYVSLEVRPTLAHDTEATIAEAKALFSRVGRPNVMIKVPATAEGLPAVVELIGSGVPVNVTLIFSISHYRAVAEAYFKGIELLLSRKGDVHLVASVASFFVSRIDTIVDKMLYEKGIRDLHGKIAIANTKLAYREFVDLYSSERWKKLAMYGTRIQRPLWASTSTKNPNYSKTLYVDTIIGPHTVNTMPPETIEELASTDLLQQNILVGIDEAEAEVEKLKSLGIDLDFVTQKLQDDGVEAFRKSFEALMTSIAKKKDGFRT